jgi:DNA polymerase III delta prime subunit
MIDVVSGEIVTGGLSMPHAPRSRAGKLTLLAGDPGLGKSLVTLDIAARVSCGRLRR